VGISQQCSQGCQAVNKKAESSLFLKPGCGAARTPYLPAAGVVTITIRQRTGGDRTDTNKIAFCANSAKTRSRLFSQNIVSSFPRTL